MSSSPREWFESLPYITRHWLAGSVIVAVGSFFGFIDPMKLLFFPSLIYNKFEVCDAPEPQLRSVTHPGASDLEISNIMDIFRNAVDDPFLAHFVSVSFLR